MTSNDIWHIWHHVNSCDISKILILRTKTSASAWVLFASRAASSFVQACWNTVSLERNDSWRACPLNRRNGASKIRWFVISNHASWLYNTLPHLDFEVWNVRLWWLGGGMELMTSPLEHFMQFLWVSKALNALNCSKSLSSYHGIMRLAGLDVCKIL